MFHLRCFRNIKDLVMLELKKKYIFFLKFGINLLMTMRIFFSFIFRCNKS